MGGHTHLIPASARGRTITPAPASARGRALSPASPPEEVNLRSRITMEVDDEYN